MDRRRTIPALAAGCILLFAAPAFAQEEGHGDHDAMMAAYMEAGKPGAPHAGLAEMAGTWDITLKMWMDPSAPPMESTATATSEMIMDGRFLRELIEGDFMGMPFRGAAVTGYNNATGEYEAAWIDNMGTMIYRYTGSMNEDGDLVLRSTFKDPATGESVSTRSIRTMVSADEMREVAYETREGQERKVMELVSKRRG